MDLQEQRMQCLKMAFELGGKPEPIISAAQQMMDFVTGKPEPEILVSADPVHENGSTLEPAAEPVPDPIAACGTALVMPEGGELADAVLTSDASAPAVEADPQTGEIATSALEAAEADLVVEAAPSEILDEVTKELETATTALAAENVPQVEAVEKDPAEATELAAASSAEAICATSETDTSAN